MTSPTSNDNTVTEGAERGPDAHGQAALLLVEGLIHGLISRSILTVGDAVEIVGRTAEVKVVVADEAGDPPATMHKSLALLNAIQASLSHDLPAA